MFGELELREKACRILGVSWGANKEEIRKAYWRLAMKHHPDRNPGSEIAGERFKLISEAYEILTKMRNGRGCLLSKIEEDLMPSWRLKPYDKWWREVFTDFVW